MASAVVLKHKRLRRLCIEASYDRYELA